jgi:hypothetical protein
MPLFYFDIHGSSKDAIRDDEGLPFLAWRTPVTMP